MREGIIKIYLKSIILKKSMSQEEVGNKESKVGVLTVSCLQPKDMLISDIRMTLKP